MAPDDIQNGNGNSPSPDLVSALERDQIQPHYLPKVDLRTGRVIGIEALARLKDPELGFIAAEEFLGGVEAGEHMRGLTKQMLESSTRAAGDWWRSGLRLQLSVNLSPDAFSAPEWRLHEIVARTLAEADLPGEALQFEVTEDALAKEPDRMKKALRRLGALGATVSIDDFGTGLFSFRQLLSLSIEELKIDRSLILGLDTDEDRTIVRSIIHLAHQMGLQVVAEGVETEEAWRQLRSMGCERAQGFLIAKPLPAREVPAWLAAWSHRARELSSTKRIQRRIKTAARRARPAEATA
jgi:EAL domain-containing protein (putative c-di-GMP-specific phosphodiesterase class I)